MICTDTWTRPAWDLGTEIQDPAEGQSRTADLDFRCLQAEG